MSQAVIRRMYGTGFLLWAGLAVVSASPAVSFTPGIGATEGSLPGATRGWTFDVVASTGILVDALGVYDAGADGLAQAHDVGLWNSSGSLVASATVLAGTADPLDSNNEFRLASISPVMLLPGTYTIGAFYVNQSTDAFYRGGGSVLSQSFNPAISFDTAAAASGVSSLAEPNTNFPFGSGYYGPSFDLEIPSSAPEPATWGLLAGSVGLLYLQKRLRGRATRSAV